MVTETAFESALERPALTSIQHIPYWSRESDQDMVCTDVRAETHDVKTFTFRSREDRYFSFMAGQYFSFDFDIDGQCLSRCYSVSTSALMTHSISVTVKRVEGGSVSNWLHEKLTPGTAVRAMGPSGKFTLDGNPEDKYLFITGGAGITPVMSMVRTLSDARKFPNIMFFHASRSTQDLIFEDELRWRAKTTPNFRLFFLPERTEDGTPHAGIAGRVNEALLSMVVPDLVQRRIMCCGPAPFMRAVRELATKLGVPVNQYFEENFAGGDVGAATPQHAPSSSSPAGTAQVAAAAETSAHVASTVAAKVAAPIAENTFQLKLVKQDKTIAVASKDKLLDAMRQSGLHIPSSCGEGLCGTCKTKLVSGQVHMEHAGGIRQREIDAGFFLPCCSTALSDLVIDR